MFICFLLICSNIFCLCYTELSSLHAHVWMFPIACRCCSFAFNHLSFFVLQKEISKGRLDYFFHHRSMSFWIIIVLDFSLFQVLEAINSYNYWHNNTAFFVFIKVTFPSYIFLFFFSSPFKYKKVFTYLISFRSNWCLSWDYFWGSLFCFIPFYQFCFIYLRC